MTITTDGREVVYGLFNADGFECENLLGVFGSERDAEATRNRVEMLIRRFYREHLESDWRGSVTVRVLALGEYHMPADAQYVLDEMKRG